MHEGWRRTRKLITIGTPYRGSVQALDFVSNGIRRRAGAHVVDLTRLARSLTSVYQLLPTYKMLAKRGREFVALVDDPDVPEVEHERVRAAAEFHEEIDCAERANRALAEYADSGYDLLAITGMSQPTLQSAHRVDERLVALPAYDGENRDGDGRVMRESGAPFSDGRLAPAWVVNQQHGSLQNDDSVIAQIKGALELPVSVLRDGESDVKFGLELDDLHFAGDPIPVRVLVAGDVPAPEVRILDVSTNEELERRVLTRSGDAYEAELRPLTPATYRAFVDVRGATPVVGVFTVTAV